MINRRTFFNSVAAFLAAPAIIRVASLMPISVQEPLDIGGGVQYPIDQFPIVHPDLVKMWSRKILRDALQETMAVKFIPNANHDFVRLIDGR